MVLPRRHVGELEELEPDEASELWSAVTDAVRAIKGAYTPGGVNIGANLGRAAGAGVPGHFHVHCLPRWNGDTNFMTSVADTRVMPEALSVSWRKLTEAWPGAQPRG
jgi:ATP adenylyltransferase